MMSPDIFLIKLRLRLAYYFENFLLMAKSFPKKYLSRFIIILVRLLTAKKAIKNSEKRTKPHLLILRNKSYSQKSAQISTEAFHLDNTLTDSNLATFEILTYDEDLHISPLSDLKVISKCRQTRPDAVILSSWWKTSPNHPSIHAIKFIRKDLKIPVTAIWWDTCSESFRPVLESLMDQLDLHVIIDNPCLFYINKSHPHFDRVISLWPPQDSKLFYPSANNQDLPVSFLGQISSYRSYRGEVLNHLLSAGVAGKFLTQDRDQQVSHQEYAKIMRSSKISINFSQSVSCNQLKSRALEILFSGALLLESENEQISKLFVPMKDYVPFSSKEDLVEKIHYYLKNQDELMKIAKQGTETALLHYNSHRFWELLLKKLTLI